MDRRDGAGGDAGLAAGGQRPLQGGLVRLCAARGWDHSISLTNDMWRKPVLEQTEGLPDAAWTDIGVEEAILATHRPAGWGAEQHYVVIRPCVENGQGLLVPRHTVILVSCDDLPLKELVLRHRGKQCACPDGQVGERLQGPAHRLGLHHPPCRGYRANQAFHTLGWIAQALPRVVQFTALPKRAHRRGLRPVIRHVMRPAAYMARSGAAAVRAL